MRNDPALPHGGSWSPAKLIMIMMVVIVVMMGMVVIMIMMVMLEPAAGA